MKISVEQREKILKILVGILGLSLVFLISFILIKNKDKKDDKKVPSAVEANTNKNVVKEQEVDGLRFSNTALVIENGESKLTTEVKNTTKQDIELKSFNIIAKDKNGKEIVTLLGYVGEVIKKGETKNIISSTDRNLSKASSLEYNINY